MRWGDGGWRAARAARWAARLVVLTAGVAVLSPMVAPHDAGAETCPMELLVRCAGSGAPPSPTSTTTTVPPTSTTLRQASSGEATTRLFVLLNAERDRAGLTRFSARSDVAEIASAWSAAMAGAGDLSHNDAYFTKATRQRLHARLLGENVARNADVDAAHRALMASPPHRANILDGRFTIVGIGAELREGSWWLTEDFLQPAPAAPDLDRPRGSASPAARPSAPTTAAVPVAAPTTPKHDAGEVLAADPSASIEDQGRPHRAAAPRDTLTVARESVIVARIIATLLAVGVLGCVSTRIATRGSSAARPTARLQKVRRRKRGPKEPRMQSTPERRMPVVTDDVTSVADIGAGDLLAVVAHSLLGSMSIIHGTSRLVRDRFDQLSQDRLFELLDLVGVQANYVSEVLKDLVRSGNPEAVAALDTLLSDGTST